MLRDISVPEDAEQTEEARLASLHRYRVLDTPREEAFERITRLAARFLDAPISLVSLIDRDRQWIKSCRGWSTTETSRDISFCTHAVAARDLVVVPDATQDPRFKENPLVTGPERIRSYAGAPLRMQDGYVLGTLCVLDTKPRKFAHEELTTLTELADVVVDELELRLALFERGEAERQMATALADARKALEARALFLSSMSHELRTPLNAILGFAQLLQSEELDPAHRQDVDEIAIAARSLLEMINQILATADKDPAPPS